MLTQLTHAVTFWSCKGELDKFKIEQYENAHKLKNCKGFIIDVWDNNGGSSRFAYSVAQMFFDGAFGDGSMKSPIYIPAVKTSMDFHGDRTLELSQPHELMVDKMRRHQLWYDEHFFW